MKNIEFTLNISDLVDTKAEAVYSCSYVVQPAEPQNGILKSYNEVYSLDLLGMYDADDNLLDVDSTLQGAIETLALNYVGGFMKSLGPFVKCRNGGCMGHGVNYIILEGDWIIIRCIQCTSKSWSAKPVFDSYDAAMLASVKGDM